MKDYITSNKELPEAIFCANDEMAIGVINCCHEYNINIPSQIKVTGFDNILLGQYVNPSLTTIDINRADWSKNLANMIVDAIEDKLGDVTNYSPKYKIIRRESF